MEKKNPTTLSSPSLGATVKYVLFIIFASHLYCLFLKVHRDGAVPSYPWGAVPQYPFIWLSGKGFCSHVLICSQKWPYKREPCNSICVFPGYENCIYLFQCFRYTCTTPIPVTSAEQIQFRGKELASIPHSTWSVELVSQSTFLQWCNWKNPAFP